MMNMLIMTLILTTEMKVSLDAMVGTTMTLILETVGPIGGKRYHEIISFFPG